MSKILTSAAVLLTVAATLAFTACDKHRSGTEPLLDVTDSNMAGNWCVVSWSDGKTLGEGCYVYLRMIRKDKRFELYHNIDTQTAQPRKITGEYNITTDDEFGAVIIGKYDHGNGGWAHRYIVAPLTGGRMVWTALDDPTDVTVYDKVAEIPAEILDAVPETESAE